MHESHLDYCSWLRLLFGSFKDKAPYIAAVGLFDHYLFFASFLAVSICLTLHVSLAQVVPKFFHVFKMGRTGVPRRGAKRQDGAEVVEDRHRGIVLLRVSDDEARSHLSLTLSGWHDHSVPWVGTSSVAMTILKTLMIHNTVG